MHRRKFYPRLLNTAKFAWLLASFVVQAEAEHPHAFFKDSQSMSCTTCHKVNPVINNLNVLDTRNRPVDREKFSLDGTTMCTSCHNPDDGHKVGLKLDFQAPADLPLDKKNKMTCLTCHYTHGNLTSERPQASASFMDRLFDAERLHKSFLLRRNNTNGELCLTCHNATTGST